MMSSQVPLMSEFYHQLAFVSSVLAGFAFTFYGSLLTLTSTRLAVSCAAWFAVAASICFLLVTLGTTFAAVTAASLAAGAPMPLALARQLPVLSTCFFLGLALLLTSFGLGGWARSHALGWATSLVGGVGLLAALWVLWPFLHGHSTALP